MTELCKVMHLNQQKSGRSPFKIASIQSVHIFFLGATAPIWALVYLHETPFHFGFLDHRQSVGLLGRVIGSSQGLYL
jgi:hypothetical protein